MKNKWLNLVLLLTNRIYNRKQLIVGQTGLEAVYNIFLLFFWEIFLAVTSLPLYLTLKSRDVTAYFADQGSYAQVNFDYNLRRILTVTGVGVIALVWLAKLLIIVLTPTVFGPLQLYSVGDLQPADITQQELVAADTGIQTARVVNTMARPELRQVKKIRGGNYVFSGVGQPLATVVLLLSDQQTAVYTADADSAGNWRIEQLQSNFRLSEGNHSVLVFSYNQQQGTRSETAPTQYFKVTSTWFDLIAKNIDSLANWSVIIIILLGIFLTILTL
ncbi:MAG: hypothetical protein WC668_04990 [Patescibacteria group bacterium]|jgi:hypothetical protein